MLNQLDPEFSSPELTVQVAQKVVAEIPLNTLLERVSDINNPLQMDAYVQILSYVAHCRAFVFELQNFLQKNCFPRSCLLLALFRMERITFISMLQCVL